MQKISNTINGREIIITKFLLGTLVFFALLYGYFLGTTVLNVVGRGQMERQALNMRSKVAELEVSYITLKNKIDRNLAYELGFEDVSKTSYVSRAPAGKVLSLNNEF